MRFTGRDASWLAVVIAASVVLSTASFIGGLQQGYTYGLSNNADYVNLKYNHERATDCLKKHGLWPGCGED
jgi:hypothetical protein